MEKYIDKTSDVQSAALIYSYCVPKKYKNKTVYKWIEK